MVKDSRCQSKESQPFRFRAIQGHDPQKEEIIPPQIEEMITFITKEIIVGWSRWAHFVHSTNGLYVLTFGLIYLILVGDLIFIIIVFSWTSFFLSCRETSFFSSSLSSELSSGALR